MGKITKSCRLPNMWLRTEVIETLKPSRSSREKIGHNFLKTYHRSNGYFKDISIKSDYTKPFFYIPVLL